MTAKHMGFMISIRETRSPKIVDNERCYRASIKIGNFCERFNLPLDVWGANDYRQQWREGITRLLDGELLTCLVTEMRDPKTSHCIGTWPMYAENDKVIFHNQILVCSRSFIRRFKETNIYDFLSPRETNSEDGMPISEWSIKRSALEEFLRSLKSDGTG